MSPRSSRGPTVPGNRPVDGPARRRRVYDVVFESEDAAGETFDVLLILAILASVLVVMLDSVASFAAEHRTTLAGLEWCFTILFTIEYGVRLATVRSRRRYALSFFGIIDLLSIVPTYLSLVLPGSRFFAVVRVLRVVRVFRVLKLVQYVGEMAVLSRALVASRYRNHGLPIAVLSMVVVLGSVMYLIEGSDAGFTSIPMSVYWAVVTLTTVGFGDITPLTAVGKFLAALIMLMGYGLIAVPTGIFSAELAAAGATRRAASRDSCPACGETGHHLDARFCKRCAASLEPRG